MSAVVARQASLAAEEAAADALAARVTRARAQLDALRRAHGDARGSLQSAQAALAGARADCDALREKHRTIVGELDRLAASLAPALEPLVDWRTRLEQSPAVLREECQSWVDLWGGHTRDKAEGERAIVELERELTEARVELRQAESAQQGHAGEEQLLRKQVAALGAERQGLLGERRRTSSSSSLSRRSPAPSTRARP